MPLEELRELVRKECWTLTPWPDAGWAGRMGTHAPCCCYRSGRQVFWGEADKDPLEFEEYREIVDWRLARTAPSGWMWTECSSFQLGKNAQCFPWTKGTRWRLSTK